MKIVNNKTCVDISIRDNFDNILIMKKEIELNSTNYQDILVFFSEILLELNSAREVIYHILIE